MKRKGEESKELLETKIEESEPKKLKLSNNASSVQNHVDLSKSIKENLILPKHLSEENNIQDVLNHKSSLFEPHFRNIAEYLLNHVSLCVRNAEDNLTRFRMSEIEFYATTKYREYLHEDPFSHCHPLQMTPGVWYFHQSTSKTNDDNYKGGSYKGMDFTFGFVNEQGAKHKSFGGILIRSLEMLQDDDKRAKFIDGPSKCVDQVLEQANVSSIHELVSKRFPKASETKGVHLPIEKPENIDSYPLYLERYTFAQQHLVLASSRVGMSLKQNNEHIGRARFVVKPYRYFIHASSIKKGKNQMVLSLYHKLVTEALKARDETDIKKLKDDEKKSIIDKVSELTGAVKKHAEKYINGYEKGRENAVEVKDDGKFNLNASMKSLFGVNINGDDLCKMHGMLYKLM